MMDSPSLQAGLELHRAGRFDDARAIYEAVLADDPKNAEASHLLGVLLYQTGAHDRALAAIDAAIAVDDGVAKYHSNRAAVLSATGDDEAAIGALERAVDLDPGDAGLQANLGAALMLADRLDEAASVADRALAIDPSNAAALDMAAVCLWRSRRLPEALERAQAAVRAAPGSTGYRNNLALILKASGRSADAETELRTALGIDADSVDVLRNLGVLCLESGRNSEAKDLFRRVIALAPTNAAAHSNLANVLRREGDLAAALPAYRRAVELAPGNPVYHSNLCFALTGSPAHADAEILAEHRAWNDRHAAALTAVAPPVDRPRDADRRLRIGYVSPDFKRHPMGYFTLPVLGNHDRERVEVFCYSNVIIEDDVTRTFKGLGHTWRDIAHLDDAAAAQLIRDDGIDILVDLAGHLNRNRLLVFARRPAPVQVTWQGYPFSTGVAAIDYLLGDAVQTPEGEAELYTEEVVRLPNSMVCIAFPEDAPAPGPLPCEASGRVTFGSNNNPAKINDGVVDLWARILDGVPGSRLLLKFGGLDDPATGGRIRALFAARGIDDGRIELRGGSDHMEVFKTYDEIDIGLDPFPFNGDTTTLEALYMGVPVVALRGTRKIGRMAAGHLTATGLAELVADTADDYVRIAVTLAGDRARLGGLRAGLRDQVLASPVCNGPGFTADLEAVYTDLWRRWCAAD